MPIVAFIVQSKPTVGLIVQSTPISMLGGGIIAVANVIPLYRLESVALCAAFIEPAGTKSEIGAEKLIMENLLLAASIAMINSFHF